MNESRSADAEFGPDTRLPFPTVGVGASAGGLEAFTTLLRHLPAEPGMAFVLVMHLDPHHKSLLPEILERETAMPVEAAVDGLQVQANHVYVIPPDAIVTIEQGRLRVASRSDAVPPFMPIDHFLRSLSLDQGSRGVAVILSGGGTDGALGLDEIKAMNGVTFAQDEATAKHDAMPRSAIGTGSVDFVLPPADIAREVVRVGSLFRDDFERRGVQGAGEIHSYRAILDTVCAATRMDFHQYKPATMSRRIRRRMALVGKEDFASYAGFLKERPAEVLALHQDLLIRVTSFFRDPAVYDALREKVFPRLVEGRAEGNPIRIWVAGCSTGEEAYSIAILLLEFLGNAADGAPIKILASDVNEAALDRARLGVYVDNIAMDVSAERLQRYFVPSKGSYQICKSIRDLCVFSHHNLVKDTPFANLDLVSCRNVLIYLDASLQKRVLPLFHYALKSTGALLLGTSETVGAFTDLFGVLDKENRLYVRKPAASRVHFDFVDAPRDRPAGKAERAKGAAFDDGSASAVQKEADRVLLARYVPASLVVDEGMNILQFRGPVGRYLKPTSGSASLEVMKMVREGLGMELQAAVARARSQGAPVDRHAVRFQDEGRSRQVSLEVVPLRRAAHPSACYLVLLKEEEDDDDRGVEASATRAPSGEGDASRPAARLAQELSATRDYLQSVLEENEAASEELKSAHEEIVASNEELQSANEELQSAKEEQQSVNEELATVNDELKHRNRELARLNDDLLNLLASLDLPVVMVGRDLRIRRFTPAAESLFNLIPTDVGRPIGDLRPKLAVPDLDVLLAEVVRTLAVKELEVKDFEGRWHLLRVRPYVTGDNRIDGAALAVLDVDAMKRGLEQLKAARDYADAIVDAVQQPLAVLDDELRVKRANSAFYRMFSLTCLETEGRPFLELPIDFADAAALHGRLNAGSLGGAALKDLEVSIGGAPPGGRTMLFGARRFQWETGVPPVTLLVIEDVTHRKRERADADRTNYDRALANEKVLAEAEAARALAESANRQKDEFLAMLAHELRNPLAPVRSTLAILRLRSHGDPIAARALEMSERQVGHMARLLDDLLDVSRITSGKIRLQREIVDLNQAVARCVEACRPPMDARRHALTVHLPPTPMFLEADPARLEQIVGNLLTNAAKYTDPGGRIEVEARLVDDLAVLTVRDSGVGIAPDMLPRVFDLFAQADRSLDRSQGGLGIGLTLVKRLVDLHGGKVSVSSGGVGQGSEFMVSLPALPADRPSKRTKAPRPLPQRTPRRILVVDDNVDAAETLAMSLRMVGHEVETAYDPLAVAAAAVAFRAEVVILDIGLPGMSGYEVAALLLRESTLSGLLLVAVTGYGQEEDRQRSRDAGLAHHLVKPIDFAELERILATPS